MQAISVKAAKDIEVKLMSITDRDNLLVEYDNYLRTLPPSLPPVQTAESTPVGAAAAGAKRKAEKAVLTSSASKKVHDGQN